MKFSNSKNRRRGFTLIELVISAAVGAMILAGAYVCLSACLASQKMIEPRVDAMQGARVTFALIGADLRAACPLDKEFAFLGMHRAIGLIDADNIDFATHNYTPLRPHEADYCETSYFVEQDPATGLLTLWRRRNPTLALDPLSGGRNEPLARGLAGVRFEYSDGLDWYDSWGQTNKDKVTGMIAQEASNLEGLPQAVRVTLSFPSGGRNAPSTGVTNEGVSSAPLVFQSVMRLELADAAALPVAGGASTSGTQTSGNSNNQRPSNPNGPPPGADDNNPQPPGLNQ